MGSKLYVSVTVTECKMKKYYDFIIYLTCNLDNCIVHQIAQKMNIGNSVKVIFFSEIDALELCLFS